MGTFDLSRLGRSARRAKNNLGIVTLPTSKDKVGVNYRTEALEKIDKYLESRQYDHLTDWMEAECCQDPYIPIRKRKPRIIYNFGKILTNKVAAKLLGKAVFPSFNLEEDPDTTELIQLIHRVSYFRARLLSAIKPFISHGSVFVRFYFVNGQLMLEHFNPKRCYPEFDDAGVLTKMVIRYVYQDAADLDERGKPREKWYKLELTRESDILYDNPPFVLNTEPVFKVVSQMNHQLGFVQGEWFRNKEDRHSPDGQGLLVELFDFIDSLNYNLSQMDRAVSYALDPQLAVSGMDIEEIEALIKSSAKGWNLGRDGQAQFLEIQGAGIQRAEETKKSFIHDISDLARVVMLDPEKIVGSAQSAKAMEVLHAPLVELIDELRPPTEKGLISLNQKILVATIIYNKRGQQVMITLPPGYAPKSLDMQASWPEVFQKTMQDLQQKVQVASSASNANIISRETALRFIAKDFDVENIEEEIQKINTQPQFGGFFGG